MQDKFTIHGHFILNKVWSNVILFLTFLVEGGPSGFVNPNRIILVFWCRLFCLGFLKYIEKKVWLTAILDAVFSTNWNLLYLFYSFPQLETHRAGNNNFHAIASFGVGLPALRP